MMRLILTFVALFFMQTLSFAQGYEINIELKDYDNDSIFIANYLLDKQYLRDTAVLKNGKYTFKGEKELEGGMYLVVLPPDNKFFQVLLNPGEQQFNITTTAADPSGDIQIKGSPDNQLFYDYLSFLGKKRPEADNLRKALEAAAEGSPEKVKLTADLDALNVAVETYQADLISNHPKSMTAAILKSNKQPQMPEFEEKDEKKLQTLQWQWTKQHYFDNIDLTDPRILRTPFLFQRVDYFVEKLTVQHPDSIAHSISSVLNKMEPAKETFKMYLVHYLNKYAASKVVGFDAIYVDLVEKFYMTGKADWTEEEQMTKIIDNAKTLKPLLIGKIAPDIRMETQDKKEIYLHKIDSEYTILFFWDPKCGHCKKSMPDMLEFYKTYKEKGVEIVAVCTKFMDETKTCWETIEEREMGIWLNTVDPYHRSRYKIIYDIKSTPQIYILDKDKKIISKKIGAEQLGEVMDQIIMRDAERLKESNK